MEIKLNSSVKAARKGFGEKRNTFVATAIVNGTGHTDVSSPARV